MFSSVLCTVKYLACARSSLLLLPQDNQDTPKLLPGNPFCSDDMDWGEVRSQSKPLPGGLMRTGLRMTIDFDDCGCLERSLVPHTLPDALSEIVSALAD